MTTLEKVTSGKTSAPRRTLLYGVHGIGKSTFGASAPNPIFIPTEDGLAEIDCKKFPLVTTYAEMIAVLTELYTKKHKYRTVVIDSLDQLERLIWAQVCKDRNVKSIEDIGYQKGYTFALTYWRDIFEGLGALRSERGMNIILIAHADIRSFQNPETDSYDRFTPKLHKHATAAVCEWCDEILFATYKVMTRQEDRGFGQKKVKGISTGERIIRTTERASHIAKNRLDLPDELPFSKDNAWKEYAKHFPNNGKKGE